MIHRFPFLLSLLLATAASGNPSCPVQQLAIDAALGDSQAQYNLAVEFWRGQSLPRDLSKAAILWRLAYEQGDLDAASNLGYLLFNAQGVQRDQEAAIKLWRIAASGGQPEAHLHLSREHSPGGYLAPDALEAYARALAAKLIASRSKGELAGAIIKDADAELEVLRPQLTAPQIQQAEQRAREYARIEQ